MRIEFNCSTCLEDYPYDDLRIYAPCGHAFCARCMRQWKRTNRDTCMVCRERSKIVRPYLPQPVLKPDTRSPNPDGGLPTEQLLQDMRDRVRKAREDAAKPDRAEALATGGLDELTNSLQAAGVEIQSDILVAIEELKDTHIAQCRALKADTERFQAEVAALRRQVASHDAALATAQRRAKAEAKERVRIAERAAHDALATAEVAAGEVVQLRQRVSTLTEDLEKERAHVQEFKGKITRFQAKRHKAEAEVKLYKTQLQLAEERQQKQILDNGSQPSASVTYRDPVPEASTVRIALGTNQDEHMFEGDDSLVVLDDDEDELQISPPRPTKPIRAHPTKVIQPAFSGQRFGSDWLLTKQIHRKRPAPSTTSSIGPLKVKNGRVSGVVATGPRKRVKCTA